MKEEEFLSLKPERWMIMILLEVIKSRLKTLDCIYPDGLGRRAFVDLFVLPEKNKDVFEKWLSGMPTDVIISELQSDGWIYTHSGLIFIDEKSFAADLSDELVFVGLEKGILNEWRLIWE